MTSTLSNVALPPRIDARVGVLRDLLQAGETLSRGGAYRNYERDGTATFFLTAPYVSAAVRAGRCEAGRLQPLLPPSQQRARQRQAQFAFYQRLVRLRHEHAALCSDSIEFYVDDFPRDKVLRYKRWDGRGDVVVVGVNFDTCAA